MQRRDFLKAGLAGAGGLLVTNSIWSRVFAVPANDAASSSYGALGAPDAATGIQAPPGFATREIARAKLPVPGLGGAPVGSPGHTFPVFPDGAFVFPDPASGNPGGWILVLNSENPPPADLPFVEAAQNALGGASAIRFDANGNAIDAYRVLSGTRSNCSGGPTPWGTWLSCEEFDETEHVPTGAPPPFAQSPSEAGRVWECDPTGAAPAQVREALGRFKHEAAAFDDQGRVYLTEDLGDGCLYRFTPTSGAGTPASLASGRLDAMKVTGSAVSWVGPLSAPPTSQSTRVQAAALGATLFNGGEGCWFAPHGGSATGGVVYFTTKGDDRVWGYDTASETIEVVYPGPLVNQASRVLSGVDNLIVSPHTGKIYVVEDGGNMELVVIEDRPDLGGGRFAAPLLRMTGVKHGLVGQNPTPVPLESEVTSVSLSPDGTRLYCSSQREFVFGATYELKAPAGTVL